MLLTTVPLLAPTPAFAADDLTIGGTAVVTGTDGSGLRLRSGPGMSYRVVATAPDGSRVSVLAGPVSDGNDDWWQVSINGSSNGWAVDKYLDPAVAVSILSPTNLPFVDPGSRQFTGKLTAYADGVGGVPLNARTATGTRTHWGTVAVDPRFIPLGSQLLIEGYDMVFTAEDTGGAVKGNHIDVWLPDGSAAKTYGTQYRKITVVREGPAR
ncbi:MAG: 3D domain-containing protein [Chloroflexota bacterium]